MKRKLALATVAVLLLLAAAAVIVLRSPWAGQRLCAVAEERVRAATGVRVRLAECRVEPFALEVRARDVRVGPDDAPLFAADTVRARFVPVQAPGQRLEIAELELTGPRVVARIPAPVPGAPAARCPPDVLQRLEVRRLAVSGGALDLTLPGGERLVVERLDLRSRLLGRRGVNPLAGGGAPRLAVELGVEGGSLQGAGPPLRLRRGTAKAEVALDLSRAQVDALEVELPGITVSARGVVQQLCDPRLDVEARVRAETAALVALAGGAAPAAGTVSAELKVRGPAAGPTAEGEVRLAGVDLDGWVAGDATAQLRFAWPELRVERLELPTQGGRVEARARLTFGKQVRLEADASLRDVELGEVLARLQIPGAWVMARVSGAVRVAGTAYPLQLAGDAGLELAGFRVLQHGWERWRAGEPGFLEVPRIRLDAGVRVDRSGVRVEDGRIRAGDGTLVADAMLHFADRDGFEVRTSGTADLRLLRRVGTLPLGGLAQLEGVVVRAAPYGLPRVEGRIAVRDFRFLLLDLGEVAATVRFDDYVLRAVGAQGRRGTTRYDADVAVSLATRTPQVTEFRYAAHGRLRDLFEGAMTWQPDAVYARDALDADVELRGTARGPAGALEARFEGELGTGALLGRAFDAGRFSGRVEDGARVVFDGAELRRGPGTLHASGRIGFERPFPWSLETSFHGVRLEDLGLPGARWSGTVDGSATVLGSYEVPQVDVTGACRDVLVSTVPVGAVEVRGRLAGAELALSGRTEGANLEVAARIDGELPFQARAELSMDDVTRLFPGGPPAGLRARVRGQGSASGVLTDLGGARAEVRLDEVRGGYGEFQVDNAGPVVLEVKDRRVAVRALTMRGTNTQLSIVGAREASGALGLDARGGLDLRLLGGLLPGVTDPRGQLQIEAHVGGTLAEPLLVGSGMLREAGFRFRDAPVVFSRMTGELAFSQNRMLFDRLAATLNGGSAELEGEVELVRLFPARVRVGLQLDEVPLRMPEWLPSVLTGRLQASGSWDDMLLAGKLHVVRALYSEPLDLEKRVLEMPGRRTEQRPFDRAGEWLALDVALLVDGDARIENDVARAGLRGDLTLTGTLASVGLVGTLTVTPGSRGTFRGNEFTIEHGVVDFTDRRRVRMSLDLVADAPVRDYQVFMHLFGPYESPTLQLTAQPALSQQDIVTLLSLGYTTRDAAAAGGVTGVATAAAAQALFSASGLDDQVRRFVPRGRLLRDFNVRMTTAYSEGAGQVVPRAEFESKLLDDRVRLRYQAPFGTTRGQAAQAELRLGPRTSLQYQWDNDNPDVVSGGDHGIDLKLRWDWNE